jgi:P27 family predicted phage terminase small subunit
MSKRKTAAKSQAPAPVIECPAEMSEGARKEWDRLAPALAAEGRLTELDRPALAILCAAFADWVTATETLKTYGPVMKSPSGYPVQSPYVSIAAKHADTVIRLATEFGLTPASRKRLPVPASSSWMDSYPTLDASDLRPLVLDPEPE